MAELALSFAGAAIGGFFGGPTGAQIGWAIGSGAGSALFGEGPPDQHGPRLSDVNVQGAGYGEPIVDFRGTSPWVQGHVVWASEKRETRHKKESGGKGAPSSAQYWYTYDVDLCIVIAVGEAGTKLRRIRANKTMLLDISSGSTTVKPSWLKYRFYDGNAAQLPDPLVEAALGVGNAPAYRGYAVIVLEQFQLNANSPNFSGQIPLLEFELVRAGTSSVTTTTIDLSPASTAVTGYQLYDSTSGLVFYSAVGNNGGLPSVFAVEPYSRQVVREYWLPAGHFNNNVYGMTILNNGEWLVCTTHNGIVVFEKNSGAVVSVKSTSRNGHIKTGENYSFINPVIYGTGVRWVANTIPDAGYTIGLPPAPWSKSGNGDGIGVVPNDDVCYMCVGQTSPNAAGLMRLRLTSGTTASWDTDVLQFGPSSVKGHDVLYDQLNDCLWVLDTGITNKGPILTQIDYHAWTMLGQWDWVDDFGLSGYTVVSGSASPALYLDAATAIIYLRFYNITWMFSTIDKTLTYKSGGSGGAWCYYHSPTDTQFSGSFYFYANANKLNSVPLATETLASVVAYWCAQAGISAGNIDTSGLSGAVRGQIRGRTMPPAAMLRDLMVAHQFDMVLSDNKLKFVHRGGTSAVTITRNDLAAHSFGEALPDELSEARAQETTLPAQWSISYWDQGADWEIGTQIGRRVVTDSQHTETMQLSVAMTEVEAAKLADVLTMRVWSERMPAVVSIPAYKYAQYEPTDVITIPTDDGNKDYTIERMDRGANGVARMEITPLHRDLYTSYAVGGVTGGGGMVVAALGPTQLYLMDIPLLRDQDEGVGCYAAAGWYVDGEPGCVVNSSSDSGTTWDEVDAITEEAVIGSTINALASSLTTVIDNANSITFRPLSVSMEGRLASTTEAAMLNGANHFAVGAPGRWEILGAQTVADNGDGTLTLSTLLRGRRGTEWTVGAHVIGDTVIYLNTTDIARFEFDSSQIGVARKYRAVTIGTTIQDAADVSFTLASIWQKPYAPSHLAISNAGAGNWTATWQRRTRIGGEWRDYVDVSLGETTESYRVKVYNGATEISSVDVSAKTATVAASSGYTIRVAQLSSVVGVGYYTTITVP